MAAVSIAIVGREDEPLYLNEFASKHWKDNTSTNTNVTSSSLAAEEELFGISIEQQEDAQAESHRRRAKGDFGCSLKQQSILHTALDRFTQLAGPPPGFGWRSPGTMGSDALFVGLLCPVEDYRVYGYMTTTKIKIVVVLEDDESISLSEQHTFDERVKELLAKIHLHYVEYTMNPFTKIGERIDSPSFNATIQRDVDVFNR